ncbi:MAG: B12-binding domain-containing radical SAM protein [Deltaproteobacteria bacterium]|nr:B12-binding domain-containing radical SAM protein [Deltaproteobacteria bacterium]
MKILLVSPCEPKYVNYSKSKKVVCAALRLLAAYTPKNHKIVIADQGYGDDVHFDDIDVVGISAMTAQANASYRLAAWYRQRGAKVVMGGIHASVMSDEAAAHVDAVCVGEGDAIWGRMLDAAAAGALQKIYRPDGLFPIDRVPPFRRDLGKKQKTTFNHAMIQATRGCPYSCEFCTTSALFGKKYRCRPVENVIDEIKACGSRSIFFLDDNIFCSPAYCENLFAKMIPLKVRWVGQASLNSVTMDPALLRLAKRSGAKGLFIGIESVNHASRRASSSASKMGASDLHDVAGKIRLVLKSGLLVQSSMIFGLDGDDPTVFERTVDFLNANHVSLSSFCILTPYPGTRVHERLKAEGRLLHEDWPLYSNENVVFRPAQMTPEQLKNGSDWAGTTFYRRRSIFGRFRSNWRVPVLYLGMSAFTRHANLTNHGPGGITPMSKAEKRAWKMACTG